MFLIRVVAAVIKSVNKTGESIIFATQRGYGEFKGGWEFPGGKVEEGGGAKNKERKRKKGERNKWKREEKKK